MSGHGTLAMMQNQGIAAQVQAFRHGNGEQDAVPTQCATFAHLHHDPS